MTAQIVQQVTSGEVNDYGINTTAITTGLGNAIVVFAGWNATSFATNITIPALSVSDSAGNLWKQIDISAPTGSTTVTRGAVWIALNAQPVSWVSVSVTGVALEVSVLVTEISGLAQNVSLDFALASNGTGTGPSITGISSVTDIGFAMVVANGSTTSVSSAAPAGWTALTRVAQGTATDGVAIMPYWNSALAASTSTLSFTLNLSANYNVFFCAINSSASPPPQFSPEFPLTIVEAAFGASPGLVSSSTEFTYSSEGVTWSDISSRVIGGPVEGRLTASRGKQYELSQAEAGTLDMMLDNHDGAFTPTNPGSPYYSNALNINMSFQYGVQDWHGFDGMSLTTSSAFTLATGMNATSVQSMLLTPNGVTGFPGVANNAFIPVNQNYKYSASGWLYSVAGWATGVAITINWFNSSFVSISNTTGSFQAIPAATWTQVTRLNLTPPAGAAYVQFGFEANNTPPAATTFYVQEAAIVQGSVAVQTGLVDLLTPVRVTAWWNGVQYPVWQGFVEQWPQSWPEMPQWGFAKVTAIDAVGVLASITMSSALVSDVLIDNPYVYLPCNEQYTTAIVGSSPQFQFLFGTSPYYAPTDANGLNALNKAISNQITGVFSDGQANQPVNTGVQMNFFGDNSTAVGATSYNNALSGHRGPCMLYTDSALVPLTAAGNAYTIEFWFNWSGPVNSSINLFSTYGVPSSFWYNGANTFNGNNLLVWIKPVSTSNQLVVTLNQSSSVIGPTIIPSTLPQHVVIVVNPALFNGYTLYVNGQSFGGVVTGAFSLNTTAIGLGTATYSYDCNNSSAEATYTSNNYSAGHLAIYPYALAPGRITSHYQTGAAGYSGVSAAFRFAQIVSWALAGGIKRGGYYTLEATGVAEATQIGPAYSLNGSSAADGINQVQQSEGGLFFVKADGTATYIERQSMYNAPNVGDFGDNATSATAPLNSNPTFSNGTTGWRAFNGTFVNSGTAYAGSGSGFFTPAGSGGTAGAFMTNFNATALTAYTGGAWILSPGGYGTFQTIMHWLNGSGGTITGSGLSFSLPANSWFWTQVDSLAPAGTVFGEFGITELSTPGTANTFYISYGSVTQDSREIPFLKETEFGFDNTYVYNEVTSTQQDGPNQVITADYRDTTSQGEYFRRSALSFQQNVVSPYDVADITTWSTTQFKQPSLHLNTLKVHATGNPLVSFPTVLKLDVGDVVQVTRRPVGGAIMNSQGVIERVQVEIGSRYWYVTYQISPNSLQENVLCADTPGFDTPSTTVLGW